jgi:hypothetical protein
MSEPLTALDGMLESALKGDWQTYDANSKKMDEYIDENLKMCEETSDNKPIAVKTSGRFSTVRLKT